MIVLKLGVVMSLSIYGCQRYQELEKTHIQFTQIALALRGYIDNYAEHDYIRKYADVSKPIFLDRIPWEEGRLPFAVRRASTGKLEEWWFLENGTGEALWSWRVEIIPYLESMPASLNHVEGWSSPANRKILQKYGCYFSYGDPQGSLQDSNLFLDANALAITGPDTAFGRGDEYPKRRKELPDDIILIVEVRASGIPWPAPGDLDIRTMPQTINSPDGRGISSKYVGGFHVIFADGQVWFLSEKVPFEILRRFFTINEATEYDREELLAPYALWRSGQIGP